MNVVPDFGNILNVLPGKKQSRSAPEESSSERSFSSFLDDQRRQSNDVPNSNETTADQEAQVAATSKDTAQAGANETDEEEKANRPSAPDYLLIAQSVPVINSPVVESELADGPIASKSELSSLNEAAKGSKFSEQVLPAEGDLSTKLGNQGTQINGINATGSVGSHDLAALDPTLNTEHNLAGDISLVETPVDSELVEVTTSSIDDQALRIESELNSINRPDPPKSTEVLAAANVSTLNANRSTDDLLDSDLPLNVEQIQSTSDSTVNVGLESSFSDGNAEHSSQTFDQAPVFDFANANQTSVGNDNIHSQNTFVNTLQEVSQRPSPVEIVTTPIQDISAPTSQLKVAIVANAASLESESASTIQVDLHPAELGRLQVRIEQTGDQLHAKIIATEIASSELLLQDRQHLVEALNELGFGETSLDITHQESNDPREHDEMFHQGNTETQSTDDKQASDTTIYMSNSSVGINFVA